MNTLNIKSPAAWDELDLKQLHIVAKLLNLNLDKQTLLLTLFCVLSNVKIKHRRGKTSFIYDKLEFQLSDWQLRELCDKFNWVLETRPLDIVNPLPLNSHLIGVKFVDYFYADAMFYRYSSDPKVSYVKKALRQLGIRKLYLSKTNATAIWLWWSGVKSYLQNLYPRVFSESGDSSDKSPYYILQDIYLMLNDAKPQDNKDIAAADAHSVLHAIDSKIEYYNSLKIKS